MKKVLSEKRSKKEIPPNNSFSDSYYKKLEKFSSFQVQDQSSNRASIDIYKSQCGLVCSGKKANLFNLENGKVIE